MKNYFLRTSALLIAFVLAGAFKLTYINNNDQQRTACKTLATLVDNKSFNVNAGEKIIVTYSLENFQENNDSCWLQLDQIGRQQLQNKVFGAVYFFAMPESKVPSIENEFTNFSQYGKKLVAKFWKDPGQRQEIKKGILIRFPTIIRK